MNKAEGKQIKNKRGLLLLVAGLLLLAALILLFLGIRAGKWAAKKENLQLLTLVNAENPVPDDRQQEYALLETLVKNRNIALSRQKLMKEAWDVSFLGESRTVDVHIQRLRKKLQLGDHLATIYRYGYRFEEEP